jgi:hypothetical protein
VAGYRSRMSSGLALFRRIVLLALLGAIGGAAFKMLRARQAGDAPAAAEWPPFEPGFVPAARPAAVPPSEPAAEPADAPTPAPVRERVNEPTPYVDATGDASAPDGFPVKAKQSSRIFHVPGGRFYDRTIADRHYATAAAAEADGYRASTY